MGLFRDPIMSTGVSARLSQASIARHMLHVSPFSPRCLVTSSTYPLGTAAAAMMHTTASSSAVALTQRAASVDFKALRVNGPRLIDSIHSTCEFGKAHAYGEYVSALGAQGRGDTDMRLSRHPTQTGMARLALNDDDKKVREWLTEQAQAIGCTVTVDQMGNMFAVRPGKVNGVPPVMMGSHLDTQPTGGRYDGILGVMAGLEALRTMHDSGYETRGPVGIVNWTKFATPLPVYSVGFPRRNASDIIYQ